ncbi:MAG: RNA polymerase subunit sigma, partial [Pseudonocardia sp.]|nr:RNA polymerase subunit sigma [Pseudonocardia sp.]
MTVTMTAPAETQADTPTTDVAAATRAIPGPRATSERSRRAAAAEGRDSLETTVPGALASVAEDLDAQSPAADLVRVYLNGIGKRALLTAAEEVELARRIEAGVFAQHRLDTADAEGTTLDLQYRRDLRAVVRDGARAKNHLLEA